MLIIKYVMNKIKNKDYKNKVFPNSYTLMCDTYNVKNNIRFFFFCVYYLRIVETNTESFLTKVLKRLIAFLLSDKSIAFNASIYMISVLFLFEGFLN